jgi:hypothetical protein
VGELITIQLLRSELKLGDHAPLLCRPALRREYTRINSISGRTPQDQLSSDCPKRLCQRQHSFWIVLTTLTHSDRSRTCWKRYLSDRLQERTLAARLVATNDDLRDTNVCIDVLTTKLVNGIEQASLLLALQLRYSTATDRLRSVFGLHLVS